MEKRHNFFIALIIVVILLKQVSALGVIPGKFEVNYKPGLETEIEYKVIEDNPEQELNIKLEGEFAKYVKVNKDELVGSDTFILTLSLPEELPTPGKNIIRVRVSEKVDDELVEGTVGTSINIGAALVIYVPYPGKFLKLDLSSNNANVGEPINFLMNVKSYGTDTILMHPKIEIYSDENLIETLEFREREIKSQEEIKLKKTLDTTDYNPGKYKAIASVDYIDDTATAEHEFRIGELVINMINYTDRIKIGGIKAFEINIESGWNNNIDGAYAAVSIDKKDGTKAEFKTDTESLIPWEEKTIVGHFDSTEFEEGIHNANITLIYFGKDQGKSTSKTVKVEFYKGIDIVVVSLIIGIVTLLIIMFFIWRYFKNEKKKK